MIYGLIALSKSCCTKAFIITDFSALFGAFWREIYFQIFPRQKCQKNNKKKLCSQIEKSSKKSQTITFFMVSILAIFKSLLPLSEI
jgi:hypothetical protein